MDELNEYSYKTLNVYQDAKKFVVDVYKLLKLFPMANRISDFLGITVGIDISSKGYIVDVYRVPETISEGEFNKRLVKRCCVKKDSYKKVDIRRVLETDDDFILSY